MNNKLSNRRKIIYTMISTVKIKIIIEIKTGQNTKVVKSKYEYEYFNHIIKAVVLAWLILFYFGS